MEKCIKELVEIVSQKDEKVFKYADHRIKQIHQWIDRWIAEVESSQLIMNSKYMTSEFEDTIKEQLARNCQERLAEEVVEYTKSANKMQSKMLALRKKPKG